MLAILLALLVVGVLTGSLAWLVGQRPPPLAARVAVGAYVHLQESPPRDPVAPADLQEMERRLGGAVDVVHYFWTWGRPFTEALSVNLTGRDLLLTLKPDAGVVREVASGQHDGYLDEFARQARAWGGPVYLRYGHEMNGSWMSYSAGSPGGPSAQEFVASWVRLATRVRAQRATNVRLVWSPNELDVPAQDGNRLEDYWPGRQWVDVLGVDAYNWSAQEPRRGVGGWRSFEQVVAGPYDRVTALAPDLPVWVCEIGTPEADPAYDPPHADKGAWLTEMFRSRRFPRLTGIVYFSENDTRDTQRDWRLDSSQGSLDGWRRGRATT